MNANPQPYLSGLHGHAEITLARFARLCMPIGAPDTFRLLWLMVGQGWEPTPDTAVQAGFLNLRDTIRHLEGKGVRIEHRAVTRVSPYSGTAWTKCYRFIPSPENMIAAFGALIAGGFEERGHSVDPINRRITEAAAERLAPPSAPCRLPHGVRGKAGKEVKR